MSSTRSNLIDRLTVGLFLVALFTPLAVKPFLPVRTLSALEKRELARLPDWKWNLAGVRRFPAGLDRWFKDHFGLREPLIRLYSTWCIRVLGISPNARVVLGKNGWLFYNGRAVHDGDPISDCRGVRPLSAAALEDWRWKFQDIADWLAIRKIRFLVVFAPDKGHIYPEFLPDRINRVTEDSPLDQLVARLRERSTVPFLDLRHAIMQAKAREVIYLRTDTHWNNVGAYEAYRAVLEALRPDFPVLDPLPLAAFNRTVMPSWTGGDLARMMYADHLLRERVPLLTHRYPAARVTDYEKELQDVISTLPAPELPSALVWHDSLGNALIPLLAEHFRSVLFRWYDLGIEGRVIERQAPDVMILELGDRILRKNIQVTGSIRHEAASHRFDAAEQVLLKLDGESGFAGLRGLRGVELIPGTSPQRILKQGRSAHLEVPAVAGPDRWLPILKLELVAPGKGAVEIHWWTGEQEDFNEREQYVGVRLAAGTNTIYVCLTDPGLAGALRMDLSGPDGVYELISLAVRGVPR